MAHLIRSPSFFFRITVLCSVVFTVVGCTTVWKARFLKPTEYGDIDPETRFLKCHTFDGAVVVFEDWQLDKATQMLTGRGIHYDLDRNPVSKGKIRVAYTDIVLLETNDPQSVAETHLAVLGVVTGASLITTAVCLSNPKACFGSCPTFYVDDGTGLSLQAEGFSSSVARALEKTDVDPLYGAAPATGEQLEILMTNDALETHAVRGVSVLSVPRPDGNRVYRAPDGYYPARKELSAISCRSQTGECRHLLAAMDEEEYQSSADARNLATKETIELRFPAVDGTRGLIVGGRNSLMNTFLFYQTLAYMGIAADDWLIQLESGGAEERRLLDQWDALLSKVVVSVLTQNRGWVEAGAFDELGPIAKEIQLIHLPPDLAEGPVRIRLLLTRGYWKLDFAALAQLGPPLQATRHPVQLVRREGRADPDALAALTDPERHLMTYPGDAYTLVFKAPEGEVELFLESTGFYYEWIREQWLSEQDGDLAAQTLLEPEEALRRLAPVYKKIEADMEAVFWNSRFER